MKSCYYILLIFAIALPFLAYGQVKEQLNAFGEPAFSLTQKFEDTLREKTGYSEDLLVSRFSQFLGDKFVYYYLECSATFFKDNRKCVDHRTFLIRKDKEKTEWADIEVFTIGSIDIPLIGYKKDEDINSLLKAVGILVTPELIMNGLCE